jgi:hypothetical protein
MTTNLNTKGEKNDDNRAKRRTSMKIRSTTKVLLAGLIVIGSFGASLFAGELRGFGKVTESKLETSGNVTGRRFVCENPEKARVLMHKVGRDLSQSATEKASWEKVTIGQHQANVLVRPGQGSYLPVCKGKDVLVYTSPETSDLASVYASVATNLDGATFFDADFRYPRYLDKYSHYGIGSWYVSYWSDKNSKGKPNDVDDHFKFAKEMDLVVQPNNGGHVLRNLLPKLREYDRPYHFALWREWSPEMAIMAPEELGTTSAQFSVAPGFFGQVSAGGHRLRGWNNWMFQEQVRRLKDDPLLVDWLDPNSEVGPHKPDYLDFSENNRKNFVRFLKDVRGYSLADLGRAWHGDAAKFKSWDEAPIPLNWDLYGWEPDSIAAEREWRVQPGVPGKAAEEGLAAGYHQVDFDDGKWPALPAPGGELIAIFWTPRSWSIPSWYRGAIDVPAEWLEKKRQAGPIYLAATTFNEARGFRNPDRVWLNGKEVAAWSGCPGYPLKAQFEVTDLLKPGRNVIAYLPAFQTFRGGFFLTGQPREVYPFRDTQRNARYADWMEYVPWAIADTMENTFKAIRAVDPDRFIKMHAYANKELGIPLAARYGAFGHNTGDEGFFRPWDRRFGYVRGIPSSAEPSGSVDTPEHFKRWLGWHCFTGGPNALDYFHNIQSMMYSPAAPLWKEYMPYWKLAPRRDLKKPDLALFWSSRNNGLLPRPVPYCFDLGRGDLQGLGFSYVYVDESTVRDGLVKDYPVVWDTGTWIMDQKTVDGLKKYVEGGGTYILLQETGRHTTTKRDAWAVSDLTGFTVAEERPMSGTLSILYDQPLFKKLAGRTFYNRGKSIDYSDYNYADRCFALKPLAKDTQVIARYEDGAVAIGMRKLGKGRVIVLGSPFWRDSYDQGGMWWPGESQSDFIEDLLTQLGVAPVATADTRKVWREHYLATNGTEEYLILHNPYDEAVTFSTEWKTLRPAGRLFDPKNGKIIPGVVDGRSVRLDKLSLAPRETLIVATQPVKAPDEAVREWFADLAKFWRPSAPGEVLKRPALPLYELRLADKLSGKVLTPTEAAALPTVPEGLQLGACQSFEAFKATPDKDRRCVLATRFATPAAWEPGDTVNLYIRGWSGGYGGSVDAWLNGEKIFSQVNTSARGYGQLTDGARAEVGRLLKRDGDNQLVFTTGPNGFAGEVDVEMRPAPVETFEVAGTWQLQRDANSGLAPVTLPGEMEGLYAATSFKLPTDWKGDRVFVSLDVEGSYTAFAVNEKMVFHQLHSGLFVRYMDVTPWVKFGDDNRLMLVTLAAAQNWAPGKLKVNKVSVQRVKSRLVEE